MPADSFPAVDDNSIQSIRLSQIDALGFDLDHTLIRYKIHNLNVLVHSVIVNFLTQKKHYSNVIRTLQYNSELVSRGLVYHTSTGNFLKLAADNHIVRAMHGTDLMTTTDIQSTYGKDGILQNYDPLDNTHSVYVTLFTYFELASIGIIGTLIDLVDQGCPYESDEMNQQFREQWLSKSTDETKTEDGKNRYSQLLLDVLASFEDQWLDYTKGDYFTAIRSNPGHYCYKRPDIVQWLKTLRQKQPQLTLFTITNSRYDYSKMLLDYSFGPEWESLFDIFVAEGTKPQYFIGEKLHYSIDDSTLRAGQPVEKLELNGRYMYGNVKQMHEFLGSLHHKANPTVLYFGDHLKGDVAFPKRSGWLTGSVIEELEIETPHGVKQHTPSQTGEYTTLHRSSVWGDVLSHQSDDSESSTPVPTAIHQLIVDNSVICVACLSHLHVEDELQFQYSYGQPHCFFTSTHRGLPLPTSQKVSG